MENALHLNPNVPETKTTNNKTKPRFQKLIGGGFTTS